MLTPIQVNILQDYHDLINYLELQDKYVFGFLDSLWIFVQTMHTYLYLRKTRHGKPYLVLVLWLD